jgi:uncharacterized membrane protein
MIIAALITSLFSVANFVYLSFLHYGTKFNLVEGKSACNINAALNCDAVTVSSYATLFGIPVSNWGAIANGVLALIILIELIGLSQNRERLRRFAFWLASLGLGASVVMACISLFSLGTFCIFCILAYLLSALTWFFLYRAVKKPVLKHFVKDATDTVKVHRGYLVALLLIPALSYLSHSMVLDSLGLSRMKNIIEEGKEAWKAGVAKEFDQQNGLVFTNKNGPAKMTIVEFADFLCTHCKAASYPLHNFAESNSGVQLVFKSFPLDGTCNESMTHKGDGIRCELAYFVTCAEKLAAKGWATSEYVFANQSSWSRFNLEN